MGAWRGCTACTMSATPLMHQSEGAGSRVPMSRLGRQFTLHLQFAVRGSTRPRDYEDFLMGFPGLLKGLAHGRVDLEVLSYERTAQTNLRLNVIVFPPLIEESLLDQARRLGLRDPMQTAASTALMLWLKDLRTPFDVNPLHAAWRTWCGLTGIVVDEKAPLYLHCYGLIPMETSPEADIASPRTEVSGASDPVNLTAPHWPPRRQHDGSTETST